MPKQIIFAEKSALEKYFNNRPFGEFPEKHILKKVSITGNFVAKCGLIAEQNDICTPVLELLCESCKNA